MQLERNLPYRILVAGCLTWLAIAFAAPWARAHDLPIASWLYAVFTPICHQLPGRSFQCFGNPLAACHRCMGLYIGFTVGLLVLPYLDRLRLFLLAKPRVILLFITPMAIDVALYGINVPASRFATGFLAAFPAGLFVWAAAHQLYRQYTGTSQRTNHEWCQSK